MAFDYITAGLLCSGVKVSRDKVKAFVQAGKNDYDSLLENDTKVGELLKKNAALESEIALLKEALLAAEKATDDLREEWSLHIQQNF